MKELKTEFSTSLSDGEKLIVNHITLKKAINKLKALNHDLRIQILKLLDEHKNLTVTEIFVKLRIEQSVASQQLAILRSANLVIAKRDGKFIHYTINETQINYLNKIAVEVIK
jgi:ArsR family transcriptional regulator, virulence genes transcriptional regulator